MFKIINEEQTPKAKNVTRKKDSEEVWDGEENIAKFIKYAKSLNNCIGLAANQVSLNGKRFNKNFFVSFNDGFTKLVINPKILEYIGEKTILIEGCITWPGRKIIAERYSTIIVKYFNYKGNQVEEKLTGFDAQVFQHEYNHLQGFNEKFNFSEKIGRNDTCPCGSNKKYKNCCGVT